MKVICTLVVLLVLFAVVPLSFADTVALKNGDHLTGTIAGSDGKEVTLKTDYAGEIKIQWSAVVDVASAQPLYVVTPDKKTVNGNITVMGPDLQGLFTLPRKARCMFHWRKSRLCAREMRNKPTRKACIL